MSFCRIQMRLEKTVTIFGIYLSRRIAELIHITHVFQYHSILCVQRDIATVPPLMKDFLGNQKDTDIPVISAFREQVTYVID